MHDFPIFQKWHDTCSLIYINTFGLIYLPKLRDRRVLMRIKTLGFPKITNFGGDVREFLPSLFEYLQRYGEIEIYLEEGYGSEFGLTPEDYLKVNKKIKFVSTNEVFKKDLVMILKMPDYEKLELLRDGNSFFSMCHYPTHPQNVELFCKKGTLAFSMDGIVNDNGKRLFVDYFRTAFNACKTAFEELEKTMPDFYSENRRTINATIIGVGGAAQSAARSFEILGDNAFLHKNIPGILIRMLSRTITYSEKLMIPLLSDTDILVDASRRVGDDLKKVIIRNELIGYLPKHAIICDITLDCYGEDGQVKPFEGTICGSLSKRVIYTDDDLYNTQLPKGVDSRNRRITVGCDAWPGVTPRESIKYYENLVKDYLAILLSKELEDVKRDSDNPFERALYRSSLKNFLESEGK